MSIMVGKDTRLLVQGLGSAGRFHTDKAIAYGTNVVAGVHPGKAGTTLRFEGATDHSGVPGRPDTYAVDVPMFETVRDAVAATNANASVVYVPPFGAADAILEAVEAGLELVVCITEGIPVQDMVVVKRAMQGSGSRLVGPNCPGVITPHECKIGIMPGYIHQGGRIGVVSRSGTLTYEAVKQLSDVGLGQTTAVGIGGDPVNGTNFVDVLEMFAKDDATEGVIMIGEIGGQLEVEAARWVKENGTKPVVGFIAGETAPKGRTMGHAGAIVSGEEESAQAKKRIMKECGIHVVDSPAEIGKTMAEALK